MLSLSRTTRLRDIIDTHQRLAAELSELRFKILPRLQRVERELLSSRLDQLFIELDATIQLMADEGVKARVARPVVSFAPETLGVILTAPSCSRQNEGRYSKNPNLGNTSDTQLAVV